MTIVIMTKLEVVKKLRALSEEQGCHLSLRAALAIVNWLKEEQRDSVLRIITSRGDGNEKR